nr:protein pangolin, isoforms A/H/I/S-like isoform X2 [Cherax quadricarinatus]
MPTVSGSGEEVESQDEVKVFKYEGDEEESEKRSSENLTEDKSSLITETEENKSTHVPSSSFALASKSDGRLPETSSPFGLFASAWGADRLGYLSPFAYAYTNGTSAMVSTHFCNLVNYFVLPVFVHLYTFFFVMPVSIFEFFVTSVLICDMVLLYLCRTLHFFCYICVNRWTIIIISVSTTVLFVSAWMLWKGS